MGGGKIVIQSSHTAPGHSAIIQGMAEIKKGEVPSLISPTTLAAVFAASIAAPQASGLAEKALGAVCKSPTPTTQIAVVGAAYIGTILSIMALASKANQER